MWFVILSIADHCYSIYFVGSNRSTGYERSMKEYFGRGSLKNFLLTATMAPSDSFVRSRFKIIKRLRYRIKMH